MAIKAKSRPEIQQHRQDRIHDMKIANHHLKSFLKDFDVHYALHQMTTDNTYTYVLYSCFIR